MTLVTDLLPEFPIEAITEVERCLLQTSDRVVLVPLPVNLQEQVKDAVRGILLDLLTRGEVAQVRQEQLREAVAGISLPFEVELRKLAKYRKALEDGLIRRMQALDAMRKLVADRPVAEQDLGVAREYRLRLRVVR
jgi:hypothetical protein